MRLPWYQILVFLPLVASPLRAQRPRFPKPGFELRVEVATTPAWSLEERTGSFVNRRAGYDAGPVPGLAVAAVPVRWAALFGAFQWNGGGLGDGSGFSLAEIGLQGLLPTGTRLVPRLTAAVGRLSESGGVSFDYVSLGAGAELYLSRRFSVAVDLRRLEPGTTRVRSSPAAGPGPVATVDAAMTRLHLALAVHW